MVKKKKLTKRQWLFIMLVTLMLITMSLIYYSLGFSIGYIEGTVQSNQVCLEQINDFADVCIESIAVISLNEIGVCALKYNDTELMNFTKHLGELWSNQTIGG